MRLLHTSDWHLGQLFYEHERFDEHQAFLAWLLTQLVEQEIDVLLISGDIYHSANPPTRAENQFYQFIKSAKAACPELHIVVIAGNHDSAKRITTAKPLLAQFDTRVVGHFESQNPENCLIEIEKGQDYVAILALPYLRACDILNLKQSYSASVKQAYDAILAAKELPQHARIVAMGHLHARGAAVSEDSERALVIGGEDAIGADVFPQQADYVALGHLHKAQSVNGNEYIRYSGTPFAMSFSEKNYKHQCVIVDLLGENSINVNPLYIPKFKHLHVVPDKGLATLQEVCTQIKALPASDESAGYIRVRLSSKEMAPDFREQIDKALEGKDLLFCGIERVRQELDKTADELELKDLNEIERLDAGRLLEIAINEHPELEAKDVTEEVKALFSKLVSDIEQERVDED